jgi:reactive intermediate/imine deaminase
MSSITTHPTLQVVSTNEAPAAIGPYVQAIKVGDLVFASGCIPLDPSGQLVSGGIEEQTKQALKNLKAVVEASGSELGKVVKTTVRSHQSLCDIVNVQVSTGVLEGYERFCHCQWYLRRVLWWS